MGMIYQVTLRKCLEYELEVEAQSLTHLEAELNQVQHSELLKLVLRTISCGQKIVKVKVVSP